MKSESFDHKLADTCAQAFAAATGLGCTVSDREGAILGEHGRGCASCRLCEAAGLPAEKCIRAHNYGMAEAERFGGRYIYFCPMGLTCFTSPIVGDSGTAAKITVGPFMMVERQDFIDCELSDPSRRPASEPGRLEALLDAVPFVPPARVDQLSTLLFMAVGFMNDVSRENQMLDRARSDALQGQITSYIMKLKEEESPPPYPLHLERAFLQSIPRSGKEEAQRLLNELLGAILFTSGRNLEYVKTRVYELLVLLSRATIENGADAEHTLDLSRGYLQIITAFRSTDELCLWLTGVVNGLMDEIFAYADAKHANIIHRCTQYIGENYGSDITLEQIAHMVYLSPAYLSRVFKRETGVTFSQYLNQIRVAKAKELLRRRNLRLTDISLLVGYEDQSYFTKVFKRMTGVLPSTYREKQLARQE